MAKEPEGEKTRDDGVADGEEGVEAGKDREKGST